MKLIDYPLCTIHSPPFCENLNSFRISSNLDSKAVHTTEINKSKTYLLLETDDEGGVSIKGHTHTIYEYGIVDFYIPPENGAVDYFSNFYNVLLTNDEFEIRDRAEDVHETNHIALDGLKLFYPPPDISLVKPLRNLPGINANLNMNPVMNFVVKFDWESDQVPESPSVEYHEKMMIGANYTKVMAFLNELLLEQPIICKSELHKKKKYIESLGMTQTAINTHLPLVSYFTAHGPWLRCWIKFGFDPRVDYKNYRFQRLTKHRIKLNFLYEDLELLKIVEKNEDKFIKRKWDKETGFFKHDLIRFIKRREKKNKIDYLAGDKNKM